ncbi:hypothetical protein OH76DRAFT_1552583 [Lentinus brumalis]|uniref:Uncharacterized protein n=1 Tax=Lentinus brumalis TaxID=2498619 RepID=A0A371DPV4_9APHY|nr:hypothetical protein OH76DRAFT_1552583 [Polyporus brumalis]
MLLESDCFVRTFVRRLLHHPTDGDQKLRTLLRLPGEQPLPPPPLARCRLQTVELLKKTTSPQHEYILVHVVDGNDQPVGYIRLEWAVKPEHVSRSVRSRYSACSSSHSSFDLPPTVHRVSIYNQQPSLDGASVVYRYTWPDAGRRPSLLVFAAVAVVVNDDKPDYDPMLHPDVKMLHSNATIKYPNNLEEGGGYVKASKAGTFADLFHIVTTKDISAEHARLEPALEAKKVESAQRIHAILDRIHGGGEVSKEQRELFKRLREAV